MTIKTGSVLYGLDGSAYRLDQEIGKGGQGAVWSLSGDQSLVAKVYHAAIPPIELQKLETMCRLKGAELSRVAAWPIKLLRETRVGNPQGVLMPRISGFHSVNQLYGIKSRLRVFPQAQFPFLLHAAINTARAFATIHEAGQVVGDVNHSNLMVSQKATTAMIDCDSFQITDGSTVFVCPVGVPEFTPPELQGASFAAQRRTKEHDAFGLSILVFYLLFLGRHPFMGIYDSKQGDILALERAIAEYKFPYVLKEPSPEVLLPPFVPRLTDYPPNVGDLFKRAFTREALTRGRPAAQEWIAVLTSLASTTKQCSANPSHHYFSGLLSCPWCRVEGVVGAPIFGIRITEFRDENFNLIAVWAQI
jgi:DNA-binding helix-hairpin-helix protein with protein kinase domain